MKLSVLSNVRTNNFNDPEVSNKIGGAWAQALEQKELLNGSLYGVYHNYQGRYTEDYALSVCVEGELEGKEVLELAQDIEYKVFKVEASPDGVINTWSRIWELESFRQLNRAYLIDFELHKPDGTVEIHISVE